MLLHLTIKNLVLVDEADVPFKEGFNVLTGETGAGKSALLEALRLLAGGRGDPTMIRKGAEKAVVTGIFSLQGQEALLEEAGIDYEPEEPLIIKREVLEGKSRAFVNLQLVPVSFLKRLADHLFSLVGQGASFELRERERHRELLDLYGHLESFVDAMKEAFKKEKALEKDLSKLKNTETEKEKERELLIAVKNEIEEAAPEVDEEETLYEEFVLLQNAAERTERANETEKALQKCLEGIFSAEKSAEELVQLDQTQQDLVERLRSASLELDDVRATIENYGQRIEQDEGRRFFIDERLALLTRLRKKYGEPLKHLEEVQAQLEEIDNAEENIDALEKALELAKRTTNQCTNRLTEARKTASKQLEKALEEQLHLLNIPTAKVEVQLLPQARSASGDEGAEIFVMPNVGERLVSLCGGISGGELSRVLLALRVLLAGNEGVGTMVFDEIDANIGGATAALVGARLKELGKSTQVIAVTHFAQAARLADHHLTITKGEVNGRTLTRITPLADAENELARMGGTDSPAASRSSIAISRGQGR